MLYRLLPQLLPLVFIFQEYQTFPTSRTVKHMEMDVKLFIFFSYSTLSILAGPLIRKNGNVSFIDKNFHLHVKCTQYVAQAL